MIKYTYEFKFISIFTDKKVKIREYILKIILINLRKIDAKFHKI